MFYLIIHEGSKFQHTQDIFSIPASLTVTQAVSLSSHTNVTRKVNAEFPNVAMSVLNKFPPQCVWQRKMFVPTRVLSVTGLSTGKHYHAKLPGVYFNWSKIILDNEAILANTVSMCV